MLTTKLALMGLGFLSSSGPRRHRQAPLGRLAKHGTYSSTLATGTARNCAACGKSLPSRGRR